eukprot:c19513_g1_i1 orf=306-2783(+)
MLQAWITFSPSHALCHRCRSCSLPQNGFLYRCHISQLKALPLCLRPLLPHHHQQPKTTWSIVSCLFGKYAPSSLAQSPPISLKDSLSKDQLRAVETKDTCVRVVAGPGSGKTRVLTHRVVHLIQCGVQAEEILFITFTNKAAQEIRDRLEHLFGSQAAKDMMVGTFHSFCAKVLRWQSCFGITKNFAIYDESDSEKVLRSIFKAAQVALGKEDGDLMGSAAGYSGHLHDLENLGFLTNGSSENLMLRTCLAAREKSEEKGLGKTAAVSTATIKSVFNGIRAARLHKLTCFLAKKTNTNAPQLPKHLKEANLAFATLYENALRRNNAVDFDDLIHLVVQLLHTNHDFREVCQRRWKHILVDEFQDTDNVQYELIRLLASKNQNLFVVGDIDQAIFGWRGAEFRHMQKSLERDFPSISTFQLKENYRSSSCIVKAASVVLKLSRYDRRIGSLQALSLVPAVKMSKAAPIGIGEFDHQISEANFVVSEIQKLVSEKEAVWGSFALLYRTRVQAVQLGAALSKARIPYRILGATPFYADKEVKILLAYLQFIANPENIVALDYCLNKPPRGVGDKSVDVVKEWASRNNLSFPQALKSIHVDPVAHKQLRLRSSSREGISKFMELIDQLREMSCNSSIIHLLRTLIHKLNFEAYIEAVSHDEEQLKKHMERLQQLLVSADVAKMLYGVGSKALSSFLEDITLLANHEETLERDSAVGKNEVKLLTLHGSKGLEFDIVFLVGASDNVIPLENSDLNEERRLFYVGMTRARKRLYLTHSCNPFPWQNTKSEMSRFVKELIQMLPPRYFEMHSSRESDEVAPGYYRFKGYINH